jgi:hypothetical protein
LNASDPHAKLDEILERVKVVEHGDFELVMDAEPDDET